MYNLSNKIITYGKIKMGTTRNIDFRSKELYEQVQRLANLNTNGSCSAFIRLAVSRWQDLHSEIDELQNELREIKRENRKLAEQIDDGQLAKLATDAMTEETIDVDIEDL